MGSLWEFFFRSVSTDLSGKKVQNEDTARSAGQNTRKDSNASGTSPKGKHGPDNKAKVGQDAVKSEKVGEGEKKRGGKVGKPSNVTGKDKSSNVAQKETLKTSLATAGVSEGINSAVGHISPQSGKGDDNAQHPVKQKPGDDNLYRDCGHIRTKRVDIDLPDHIDQAELEPVQSLFPECYKLKVEYDECFQHWFANEFLNGATSLEPCKDIMKRYTSCVEKGLQDQNVNIYPDNSLYGSSDPNYRKLDHPRKKPPPGATVHNG